MGCLKWLWGRFLGVSGFRPVFGVVFMWGGLGWRFLGLLESLDEGACPALGVWGWFPACGAVGGGFSVLEAGGEFKGGAVDGVLGSGAFMLEAVEGIPGVVAHRLLGVGAGCSLERDAREVGV